MGLCKHGGHRELGYGEANERLGRKTREDGLRTQATQGPGSRIPVNAGNQNGYSRSRCASSHRRLETLAMRNDYLAAAGRIRTKRWPPNLLALRASVRG